MAGRMIYWLLLAVLVGQTPLRAQINYDDEFPKYYLETEDTFERLHELPRDTVRDTVYVNYFEDYIKQYVGDGVSLSAMLKNFDAFQRTMDSIHQLDPHAYRLFYNFLLPRDTLDRVSPVFVVSEVYLDHSRGRPAIRRLPEGGAVPADWEKTVMFRLGDRIGVRDFLRDTVLMRMSLLHIFNELQQAGNPQSLMLVVPDYNYQQKREMVQFVKSVRLMLDASRDYKFEIHTRLDVVLQEPGGEGQHLDLLYALALEVSYMGLLDRQHLTSLYAMGKPGGPATTGAVSQAGFFVPLQIVNRDSLNPGFLDQLRSHYYIARYFPSDWDAKTANLTAIDASMASLLMVADYQENYWEIYFFILVGILLIIIGLFALYYTNLSFSMFINNNLESVALISIVLALEIVAVVINMFQYMCEEDTFTLFAKNPILIFTFPLVVVAIVPILQTLSKRRKIPD